MDIQNKKNNNFLFFCLFIYMCIFCVLYVPYSFSANNADSLVSKGEEEDIYSEEAFNRFMKEIDGLSADAKASVQEDRYLPKGERPWEYYEKGMRFFVEGKYGEADALWDMALKLSRCQEIKDYMKASIERMKQQKSDLEKKKKRILNELKLELSSDSADIEGTYQKAILLYKQGKYEEARKRFEYLEAILPDYKATRGYLMLINNNEEAILHSTSAGGSRMVRDKICDRGNYYDGHTYTPSFLDDIYKDKVYSDIPEIDTAEVGISDEEIELFYKDAVALYKKGEYAKAKEAFFEIDQLSPGYKLTRYYLRCIKHDIRKAERERKIRLLHKIKQERLARRKKRIEQRRQERLALLEQKRKKYEEQLAFEQEKLEQIKQERLARKREEAKKREKERQARLEARRKAREEKLAREREEFKRKQEQRRILSQQKEWLKQLRREKLAKKRKEARRKKEERLLKIQREHELKAKARNFYRQAVLFYKNKKYKKSKDIFLQVERMFPNYKLTSRYLEKIDSILSSAKEVENKLANGESSVDVKKKQGSIGSKLAKGGKPIISKDEEFVVRKAIERRRRRMRREARQKYEAALRLYKLERFKEAKIKFLELEAYYPGYKDTLKYLSHIDEDIRKKKEREQTKRVVSNRQNRVVIQKELVRGASNNSKEKNVIKENKNKKDKISKIYHKAVVLYRKKKFSAARELFKEVESLCPGYRFTKRYLKRIERKIAGRLKHLKKKRYKEEVYKQKKILYAWEKKGDEILSKEEKEELKLRAESRRRVFEIKAQERRRQMQEKELQKAFRKMLLKKQASFDKAEREMDKMERRMERDFQRQMKEEKRERILARKREKNREKEKLQNKQDNFKVNVLGQKQVKLTQKGEIFKKKVRKEISRRLKKEIEDRRREQREKALKEKREREELRRKKREEKLAKRREERRQRLLRRKELRELKRKRKEEIAKKRKEERLNRLKERENRKSKISSGERKFKRKNRLAKRHLKYTRKQLLQRKELTYQQKKIKRLLFIKDKEEKRRLASTVAALYKDALRLYGLGEYVKAKAKFSSVELMWPGYRSAKAYIENCNLQIQLDEKIKGNNQKVLEVEENKSKIVSIDREAKSKKNLRSNKKKSKEYLNNKKKEGHFIQKISCKKIGKDEERNKNMKNRKPNLRSCKVKPELDKKKYRMLLIRQADKMYKEAVRLCKEQRTDLARSKLTLYREFVSNKKGLPISYVKKARCRIDRLFRRIRLTEKRIFILKQREKQRRERQEMERIKLRIDKMYREALDLRDSGKYSLAISKFDECEELLVSSGLSKEYVSIMKKRINIDKGRIKKLFDKQRQKKEQIVQRRDRRLAEAQKRIEERRRTEIERLERKIHEEEERLKREKELARIRIEKEKEREHQRLLKKKREKNRLKRQRFCTDNSKKKILTAGKSPIVEKQKKKSINISKKAEGLNHKKKTIEVKKRKLQLERHKILLEFERSLSDLYNRAIELYKKGLYKESQRIFNDIEQMRPKYKKVRVYLYKIDRILDKEQAFGKKMFESDSNELGNFVSDEEKKIGINFSSEGGKETKVSDVIGKKKGVVSNVEGHGKSRGEIIAEALDAIELGL